MSESKRTFDIKGNFFRLGGNEVIVGDPAPDFTVVGQDFSRKIFSDFSGKVCIIASVPSLDTSVCDRETKRFNDEA